jgi:hypothetical protein
LVGAAVAAADVARAETPEYVRTALTSFSPEPAPRWAYTLTTVRNNDARSVARFDPTKPPIERWTLLELNGRKPTPAEANQYARARAGDTTPASAQGAFQKGDIDPASITMISEDAERGEFRCAFRAEAAGANKMLGHLILRLTVAKQRPHVEQYALELKEPYSPVLGVKMRELRVTARFTAPSEGRPSFPSTQTSHFAGRWFFFSMNEDLVLTYTDFVPER